MVKVRMSPESVHQGNAITCDPMKRTASLSQPGKRGRNPLRDVVLIRLLYRHALRCSEARMARWSQFDLDSAGTKTFHVKRIKGSVDSAHTLDRMRLPVCASCGKRPTARTCSSASAAGPISADMVARVVAEAAEQAGIGFHVNPHMLRHSAGYMLANEGTDTLLIQAHLRASGYSEHNPLYCTVGEAAGGSAGAVIRQIGFPDGG